MNLKQNDLFIRKTFFRYLYPAIIATLGGTVNVFFDGVFVGQKLGSDGLSAVSLSFPVYLLMCTIGSTIASGGFIIATRFYGKQKYSDVNSVYSNCLILLIIAVFAITLLGVTFVSPIASILAGGGELSSYVETYLFITFLGSFTKIMLYLPFYFLRIIAKQKLVGTAFSVMTISNIALNYLFLFVLDFGIEGAALASVIASFISCIIAYVPLLSKNCEIKFTFKKSSLSYTKNIIKSGSPSGADNLMASLRVFTLNSLLFMIGGSAYVSIFAVLNNVSEFSLCIISGVPQAGSVLVGVFNGEKNSNAVKRLVKLEIKVGMILITLFSLLAVSLNTQLGILFGVYEFDLFVPITYLAVAMLFGMINCIFMIYYNIIGEILLSNIITICRVFVIAVITLSLISVINPNIIWLFFPLSEGLTLLIFVSIANYKKKNNETIDDILLLDNTLEKSGNVLDFSVKTTKEDICKASENISEFCEQHEMSLKTTTRISLAIEEIMMIYLEQSSGKTKFDSFDVRAFNIDNSIGLRIRCAGELIDPFKIDSDEMDIIGITIIKNIAKKTEYRDLLGFNNILVIV